MATYQWDADDYEKHSLVQYQWARTLIGQLNLIGSESVLDVGCGDGKVTAEIAACVPNGKVVGIDNSIPMITSAGKRNPVAVHPNLAFMLMDARCMVFRPFFDVVFSNAALHWVKNHRPVLKGMHRSLKPGGKLLIQMGGKGNAASLLTVIENLLIQKEWRAHFEDFAFPYGFYGTEEYEELLWECGFDIKRLALIPKDMIHDDKPGLAAWIRTTWLPYIQRVPPQKRASFIDDICVKYLARFPADANGRVHVAMMRLEAEALKRT